MKRKPPGTAADRPGDRSSRSPQTGHRREFRQEPSKRTLAPLENGNHTTTTPLCIDTAKVPTIPKGSRRPKARAPQRLERPNIEPPEMPEQPGALSVIGWPDPVIDRLGHDPRSAYVERFWLAILGPSTTWLLRRLAAGLDASPDGFDLNLAVTARSLGLGGKVSRHGPFQKSIGRLVIFELDEPFRRTISLSDGSFLPCHVAT